MFKRLLGLAPRPEAEAVQALYGEIVAAARQPAFYSAWNVPDTPLGRFEMVALHVFLVLERLRGKPAPAAVVAQGLTDDFFTDVEHSLRELGIGDLGVPKRMKKLARMFYGRANSYGAAIRAGDPAVLAAALARNVQPEAKEWPEAAWLARYVMAAATELSAQSNEAILAGAIRFPPALATQDA